MRIRRSSTIILLFENDKVVVHNFLTQTTFAASPVAIDVISRLGDWTDEIKIRDDLVGYSAESVRSSLQQLIDLDALVLEGSDAARKDADYERTWLWGPVAAAYHFGTRGGVFLTDSEALGMLSQVAKISPSPPLYLRNAAGPDVIPAPRQAAYDEPFQTMARRRSNRVLLDQAIDIQVVADCLLFSMAITAVLEFPEIGDLPLKMTPSGGARNPYEAYVFSRKVEGLPPGVYHYGAIDQTFGLMKGGAPAPFPTLLGRQDWTAKASAVIVLVANFERPMWKYHDPSAYRVTAIEAGHIAQNMLLVATRHGAVANPTAFLSIDEIEGALGLDSLTQWPLYAVTLGIADARDEADLAGVADPV